VHVLPASHVSYAAGVEIKKYINSTANPVAQILFKGTVLGTKPAPAITSFSSRGSSPQNPGILKPDITGPGVSVLAAWPFAVGPPGSQLLPGPTYNFESGTSMSTPHLSGIAALIKSKHPDWSPAAIKSAIMTTADSTDKSGDPIVDEQHKPADLFATGAGHVNPDKAVDPGLVYDIAPADYIGFLCGMYTSKEVSVIARCSVDRSTVTVIPDRMLNYPVDLGQAPIDDEPHGEPHGEERRGGTGRVPTESRPTGRCAGKGHAELTAVHRREPGAEHHAIHVAGAEHYREVRAGIATVGVRQAHREKPHLRLFCLTGRL
jgi:hypothetical protein